MTLDASGIDADFLQQLYQSVSRFVLTNTADKASRSAKIYQSTSNICWGTSWVRRPGFDLLERESELFGKGVKQNFTEAENAGVGHI
jgi:hypothetical protein